MFEKFLALLERAVVALEKLASAPAAATSAPVQPDTPTKPPGRRKAASEPESPPAETPDDDFLGGSESEPPAVVYERADVKKALQEYGTKYGMDKAQALFKKTSGVTALSDCPEDKYAAVIEATKKK